MREKDKQINSLQMDMQTMSDMESMRIKTQSSSKKIMVNVDIQTEKKQWGKRNPTQTSLDYFGQFLKEYDCDDLIVREHMSEWRSLESSMVRGRFVNESRENSYRRLHHTHYCI